MMDDRLKQLMSDTNATLEPYGLTLAISKIGLAVWHIYYYDWKKKYGSVALASERQSIPGWDMPLYSARPWPASI
ncbi:MAG: hypothetical protein NVSMB6_28530 [Burkholderiaceae bacterium]